MRIDWKEKICKLPVRRIRDMLRRMDSDGFQIGDVAKDLGISPKMAKTLVNDLVGRGWLDVKPKRELSLWQRRKRSTVYERTIAGNAFAISRAGNRISRSKAKERLDAFVQRIRAVNADDDYGWYVYEAYVFGSYLDPSTDDLGDVDVAITLRIRPIIGRNIVEHGKQRARAAGKIIRNFGHELTYCEREVRQVLKNGDRYISIDETSDLKELNATSKLLYRASRKDEKRRAARPVLRSNKTKK